MLRIRMMRFGRKHQPSYRVVVLPRGTRSGRSKYVESLGWVDPIAHKNDINKDRANYWLGVGAQPSDTVWNLFVREGIVKGDKRKKGKAGIDKPTTDNEQPTTSESAEESSDTAEQASEEAPKEEVKEESPAEEKPEEKEDVKEEEPVAEEAKEEVKEKEEPAEEAPEEKEKEEEKDVKEEKTAADEAKEDTSTEEAKKEGD